MIAAPQSTSLVVVLKAYLSSDHVSAATGKTIAITISKNGGAFGNPNAGATNATEIASGWYKVTLDTTDTATLGPLVVRGTATATDDAETIYTVVKATNGGLTGIADAVAGASGGVAIVGSAMTLAADQAVNVTKWSGTAVATPDTAGYPKVTIKSGAGTGEVNLSSGAVPVTGDLTATMKTSVTTAATAATPTVTLASVTHTGAVIPTVTTTTNLTNAPTAGDLTAAMKASVTAAVPTATANAAGLLAATAYGSVTVADHLKRTGATTAGLSSGAGTDTEVFYAIGDASRATPIVTFTVDASGTRSAVTYG